MDKKRGRPRKFKKKAFLEGLQAGHSRKEVCEQLKVSYGALEYNLRQDKYFRGKVYAAERRVRELKMQKIFDAWLKKVHGVSRSVFDDLTKRMSNGEITGDEELDEWFRLSSYYKSLKSVRRVPVLEVSNVDGDINLMTWGELKKASIIKYIEEECVDFDVRLKDLARKDPRKWGPAVRVIREWYKWNPEMQKFFVTMFAMDPIITRWLLHGPPPLPELKTYIAQKEVEFEDYKREEESFERQCESLTMREIATLEQEIKNRINAVRQREIDAYLRSRRKLSQLG